VKVNKCAKLNPKYQMFVYVFAKYFICCPRMYICSLSMVAFIFGVSVCLKIMHSRLSESQQQTMRLKLCSFKYFPFGVLFLVNL